MLRADLRHAVTGAGTNILAALAGLSAAAFHPVAAYLFGTSSHGVYRWGVACTESVLRLSPLGTDVALLRYVPSHRVAGESALERRSLRTAFWLTAASGGFFAVLAFLLSGPLARLQGTPAAAAAIRLLAPSIPIAAIVVVLVYATMGAKTMRYNLVVRGIAQPLLLLAVAGVMGLLWPTLAGLCVSHLAAATATALVAVWAVRHAFGGMPIRDALWRDSSHQGQPFLHWDMIRFAIPMGLAEFLNAVLQRTDVILIGFYAGPETVGIYAGAEAIGRAGSSVRYAFDPVASTALSESLRLDDRVRLEYNLQLMTRWTTLLTVPLLAGMAVLRHELLGLFPRPFAAASGVLVVLLFGHLVNACLGLTGYVIAMSGRSGLVLLNNLVAATANVVLCLVLLPRCGMIGAAIAASSAVAILQLLQLAEAVGLYRIVPFSAGFVKAVAAGGLALVAAEWAVPFGGMSLFWSITARVGVVVVTYVTLVLLSGLESEERDLLRRVSARLRLWTSR